MRDEVTELRARLADMIYRNKFLRERKDLPADRIPAYNEFVRLQQENKLLKERLNELD